MGTHTHLAPHRDPSAGKTDTHIQSLQSKQSASWLDMHVPDHVFFTTFPVSFHSHTVYLVLFKHD